MASEPVFEIEALLEPIPGDNPAGIDLRTDSSPSSPYYAIKDARSQARAAERQMMVDGDEAGVQVDWRPVISNGKKALTEKSKDLEVVAYMIEALARLNGFAGLRDGFRLTRELLERYWDNLYPLPDEEGLDTRVAPLTGLNGDEAEGALITPITKIPLTEGSSCGPYACYHYQQASTVAQIADPEAREKRIEQGAVSLDKINQAVAETPASFFANLAEDLTQCQEEYAKLGTVLEEKCGGKAPPASNIRSALDTCKEALNFVARDKLATAAPPEEAGAEAAEGAPAGAGGGFGDGAVKNREDAFRTLLKLAEYFRRHEPHTPVSYALEQIVRWGRMSLPELLQELIPEDIPRNAIFKQVGIRPG
jgi:type VI secretion system protein ImpA